MAEQNAFLDKAKEIARDFVWDFYQKRKSIWKIMEQMDEKNFSWIGAGPEEYLRSYDEALHYFAEQRQSGAVPLIAISEERYEDWVGRQGKNRSGGRPIPTSSICSPSSSSRKSRT